MVLEGAGVYCSDCSLPRASCIEGSDCRCAGGCSLSSSEVRRDSAGDM